MMDSIALNVVISLVFIYLLYSLLVTTINEGIAAVFRLRARTLEKGIKRMLTDNGDKTNPILEKFYKLPDIKYLGETNTKKPAYISSSSFSKAIIHLCKDIANKDATPEEQLIAGIQEIKKINPESGKYLEALLIDTKGDITEFQELTEKWFNETMDRTSGWYKKQTQKITFIVGFIIAISFNVDTISIVHNLSSNPKLATNMADIGTKYANIHKDSVGRIEKDNLEQIDFYFTKAKKQTETDIKGVNSILGLGWDIPKDTIKTNENSGKSKNVAVLTKEKGIISKVFYVLGQAFFSSSLIGFLLTALAISFGAPFWFDLLNKIMQMRGSKKPDETPQQKQNNIIINKKES
jgi:hypothetical protein